MTLKFPAFRLRSTRQSGYMKFNFSNGLLLHFDCARRDKSGSMKFYLSIISKLEIGFLLRSLRWRERPARAFNLECRKAYR